MVPSTSCGTTSFSQGTTSDGAVVTSSARARSVRSACAAKKASIRRAPAAPRPSMSTHQRLRRGTRSVRSAKVLMPAWRSTAATRGSSQWSTPSPIRGTGNGCAAELLDGGSHGASGRGAFAGRSGEELGQVVPVARPGEGRDVTTDRPDDAARRLTGRAELHRGTASPHPSTTDPRARPEVQQAPPRQAATAALRLQTGRFPRRSVYASGTAMPLRLVIGIAPTRANLFKAWHRRFRARLSLGQHERGTAAAVTCWRCRLSPFAAFAWLSGFA